MSSEEPSSESSQPSISPAQPCDSHKDLASAQTGTDQWTSNRLERSLGMSRYALFVQPSLRDPEPTAGHCMSSRPICRQDNCPEKSDASSPRTQRGYTSGSQDRLRHSIACAVGLCSIDSRMGAAPDLHCCCRVHHCESHSLHYTLQRRACNRARFL